MATTRDQALEVAAKVRAGLERIYGPRLRGAYLHGSAAWDVRGWAKEFVAACRTLCG